MVVGPVESAGQCGQRLVLETAARAVLHQADRGHRHPRCLGELLLTDAAGCHPFVECYRDGGPVLAVDGSAGGIDPMGIAVSHGPHISAQASRISTDVRFYTRTV